MLNAPRARGFNIIELMVALVILSVLLMVGAPSLGTWIQNTRVRNAAEAIQNGLQIARAEAVRRNASVRFQLVTSLASGCALSTAGTNWVVSLDDATGSCGATPGAQASDPAPRIIQARAGADGSSGVQITSGQSAITFTSLGAASPAPTNIAISNSTGTCVADGGEIRCLRIEVTPAGQVRMCDPRIAVTDPPDPQGCMQ